MSRKPQSGRVRATRLFVVGYMMLICALGATVTGIVLWLFVGKGQNESKFFLEWHRHEWGDLHLYFSLGFVALAVVHFAQHWRWIKMITPRQFGWESSKKNAVRITAATLLTVGAVFVLFGLFGDDASSYGRERNGRGQYVQMEPARSVEQPGGQSRVENERPRGRVRRRGRGPRVAATFER